MAKSHPFFRYPNHWTVRKARKQFFAHNGFGEHHYHQKWAMYWLGPIPVIQYNFYERRRGLPLHDIHHILTEYDTTLEGEAQLAAWELGSGCKDYLAAWLYDTLAAGLGLGLNRKKVLQAFLRGRRCQNLYGRSLDQDLMLRDLGSLREELYLSFSAS